MFRSSCKCALGLAIVALSVGTAAADDGTFLTDYSHLKAEPTNDFERVYVAPEAAAAATRYVAVMVDQPEIFLHPDSKYKGMKPDDMKSFADGLRTSLVDHLKDGYKIVDAPGPDVLYVRYAVSNVSLEKKKRPILAYIPAGAVVYAAKNLASGATSKVSLTQLEVEGEVLDSETQVQLAAMTARRGGSASGPTGESADWKELERLFDVAGQRLRCHLDNSRKPADQQVTCAALGAKAATP